MFLENVSIKNFKIISLLMFFFCLLAAADESFYLVRSASRNKWKIHFPEWNVL